MLHFFAKRIHDLHEAKRDERGFTLIELLVVIIIIGILAAIAIPTFLGMRQRGYNAQAESAARNAATAAKAYFTDNESYAGMDVAALDAIEPSLPNAANEAPFSTYTVTPNAGGDDFSIVVRHADGTTTYTASDTGIAES